MNLKMYFRDNYEGEFLGVYYRFTGEFERKGESIAWSINDVEEAQSNRVGTIKDLITDLLKRY